MSTPGRDRFRSTRELIPRRDELFEQAAEASRAGLRTRRDRLIVTARPILQSAVAATLAWLIAQKLVGNDQPFFAPVSAVITLGLTIGEQRKRALEIAAGVAVGIAIADALVALIGTGAWQIGVVVGLAMLGATLVGGGTLLASQAAVSAVLVATLQPPDGGFDFTRFYDALVGGGVALIVSSLVFPIDPVRLVREKATPMLQQFAASLGCLVKALQTRTPSDADAAFRATLRVDAAHDDLVDALDAAGEAARLTTRRRGRMAGRLERYAVAAGQLGRSIDNVRALARGAIRAINLDDTVPEEAIESVRELRVAVAAFDGYLESGDANAVRAAAIRSAGLANRMLEETGNLSAVHIVGQIRLADVDLLRATGMERNEAQDAIRSASLDAARSAT
jgi:uncharacterized membrane protein YgaE (UPF0421/DUF939 family)